jgi:hypothetical protein
MAKRPNTNATTSPKNAPLLPEATLILSAALLAVPVLELLEPVAVSGADVPDPLILSELWQKTEPESSDMGTNLDDPEELEELEEEAVDTSRTTVNEGKGVGYTLNLESTITTLGFKVRGCRGSDTRRTFRRKTRGNDILPSTRSEGNHTKPSD